MDSMKKAWDILKRGFKISDFQMFLFEVFGISVLDAKKLTPSQSLRQAISQGRLTEAITENEFEELINLAEAEQYEKLLERLEEINSNYKKRNIEIHRKKKLERYANDPEYRRKVLETNRQRYDREKETRRKREYRRKKKEEK